LPPSRCVHHVRCISLCAYMHVMPTRHVPTHIYNVCHTLPNFERVYAYCIHVRDNIRSEESNMQYLFLEPLQLTMKHLPTPPAYTSDHQRTL
jgi:hypothetical protein